MSVKLQIDYFFFGSQTQLFVLILHRGYKIADQDDLKVPLITSTGNKVTYILITKT